MKKLTSVLLCLALLACLCASALAENNAKDKDEVAKTVLGILGNTATMTDDEIRDVLRKAAKEENIELTEKQLDALVKICRSLEGMNKEELAARAEKIADNFYQGLIETPEKFLSWLEDIENGDYTWEDAKDSLFAGISSAAGALSGLFGNISDHFL